MSAEYVVGLKRKTVAKPKGAWPNALTNNKETLTFGNMETIAKAYRQNFSEQLERSMDDSENEIFWKTVCEMTTTGQYCLDDVISRLNGTVPEKITSAATAPIVSAPSAPPQYEHVPIYPREEDVRRIESLNSTAQNGQASGVPSTTPGTTKKTVIVEKQASVFRLSTRNQTKQPGMQSEQTSQTSTAMSGPKEAPMPSANLSSTKTEGGQPASIKPKRRRNRKSKKPSDGSTPALATTQ
jgi:hypothetical protein